MWHITSTQIVAIGRVHFAAGRQMLNHKPLPQACYKVSIDKALVGAACIPDIANNGFKTINDVLGCIVAWPKDQVIFFDAEKVYTIAHTNLTCKFLHFVFGQMFDACGTFVSNR